MHLSANCKETPGMILNASFIEFHEMVVYLKTSCQVSKIIRLFFNFSEIRFRHK